MLREDFSAELWKYVVGEKIFFSGRTETTNKKSKRRPRRFSVTHRQDELDDKIQVGYLLPLTPLQRNNLKYSNININSTTWTDFI